MMNNLSRYKSFASFMTDVSVLSRVEAWRELKYCGSRSLVDEIEKNSIGYGGISEKNILCEAHV